MTDTGIDMDTISQRFPGKVGLREMTELLAENKRLRAALAGSEAPPVAQGAAENGGQGNLSPGGESHSIMAVARHMEQDNQRDAEIKRLTAEVERLRAALEIAATGEPLPTKAMVAWAAGCRCGRHHPTGRHLKGRGPCLVKNCRCKYGRPATPALSDSPQPPGQP